MEAGIDSVVHGILLAAGSGTRFGRKKQYLSLAGVPVWRRGLDLLMSAGVDEVWLVVPEADVEPMSQTVRGLLHLHIVAGGASRSESVQAALRAIRGGDTPPYASDCILIHDAARPFTDAEDVQRVLAAAMQSGGAILVRACTDTVKHIGEGTEVLDTIPRRELALAETPQVFWWQWMREEYLPAHSNKLAGATDDASIMEMAGKHVEVVFAKQPNLKITTQTDWEYAQWLATRRWGGV